jgi:hypothetical protein
MQAHGARLPLHVDTETVADRTPTTAEGRPRCTNLVSLGTISIYRIDTSIFG